jgi:hypothetical protein
MGVDWGVLRRPLSLKAGLFAGFLFSALGAQSGDGGGAGLDVGGG